LLYIQTKNDPLQWPASHRHIIRLYPWVCHVILGQQLLANQVIAYPYIQLWWKVSMLVVLILAVSKPICILYCVVGHSWIIGHKVQRTKDIITMIICHRLSRFVITCCPATIKTRLVRINRRWSATVSTIIVPSGVLNNLIVILYIAKKGERRAFRIPAICHHCIFLNPNQTLIVLK
jgi:hypothetical protein